MAENEGLRIYELARDTDITGGELLLSSDTDGKTRPIKVNDLKAYVNSYILEKLYKLEYENKELEEKLYWLEDRIDKVEFHNDKKPCIFSKQWWKNLFS